MVGSFSPKLVAINAYHLVKTSWYQSSTSWNNWSLRNN